MRPFSLSLDAWEILVSSVLGYAMAATAVGIVLVIREVARAQAAPGRAQLSVAALLYALGGICSAGIIPVVMLWSGAFDQDNAVPPLAMLMAGAVWAAITWKKLAPRKRGIAS